MTSLLKLGYLILAGIVLQTPVDGQRLIERLLVYEIPEMEQIKVKKQQVYLEDEHTMNVVTYQCRYNTITKDNDVLLQHLRTNAIKHGMDDKEY